MLFPDTSPLLLKHPHGCRWEAGNCKKWDFLPPTCKVVRAGFQCMSVSSFLFFFFSSSQYISHLASVYAAEFLILLPAPPKFWGYKQEQTCLVLHNFRDWTQDFLHARQVFYQLSYSPSPLPMILLGDSSLLSSWNKRWYGKAGNNTRLLLRAISLQKNGMMTLPVSERNPRDGYKHPTVHTVTVPSNEKLPEKDAFCSKSSEFCKPFTRLSWWSSGPRAQRKCW